LPCERELHPGNPRTTHVGINGGLAGLLFHCCGYNRWYRKDALDNRSLLVLALFFAEDARFFLRSKGASLGHRIFGIKIIRFADGGMLTPLQALIRSSLLITVSFCHHF
jgi:hypothetical protein